jgi:hypothetical protein
VPAGLVTQAWSVSSGLVAHDTSALVIHGEPVPISGGDDNDEGSGQVTSAETRGSAAANA